MRTFVILDYTIHCVTDMGIVKVLNIQYTASQIRIVNVFNMQYTVSQIRIVKVLNIQYTVTQICAWSRF